MYSMKYPLPSSAPCMGYMYVRASHSAYYHFNHGFGVGCPRLRLLLPSAASSGLVSVQRTVVALPESNTFCTGPLYRSCHIRVPICRCASIKHCDGTSVVCFCAQYPYGKYSETTDTSGYKLPDFCLSGQKYLDMLLQIQPCPLVLLLICRLIS
jgi:hypothetical protein